MITLPRSCVPCEKIEEDGYDWYDRHRRKLEEVKTKQADIVFTAWIKTTLWAQRLRLRIGRLRQLFSF